MINMRSAEKLFIPVRIILVIAMLGLMGPHGGASAAIISTESAVQADQARSDIRKVLERAEIRDALMKQGLDAAEATQRVDSLTDAEAVRLANEIEKLPAGGNALVVAVVAATIVFLILLFTDIAGYTDIFPFVKK